MANISNKSNNKRVCHRDLRKKLVVLHIVPGRIQTKRLKILKDSAQRHGYSIRDHFTNEVTHVLTEFDTREMVFRALKLTASDGPAELSDLGDDVAILNTKWLSDSIKLGQPITARSELHNYELQSETKSEAAESPVDRTVTKNANYACQRRTLLEYKKTKLVDALSVLAMHAEYRSDDEQHDYSRNLAFCKAIAVLKSLSFEVTSTEQVEALVDIGDHSCRVIQELLDTGKCREVEDILSSEWFQAMDLFNSIYGIGPSTAKWLFNSGLRTIDDVKNHSFRNDERILYGLAFYDDLNTPIEIVEAEQIMEILAAEAEACLPGVTVTLVGGFRRGKKTGHDADFLLSHPVEGNEEGLLPEVCHRLQNKGYTLHGKYYANSYKKNHFEKSLRYGFHTTMDDYEKTFLVFKLPRPGTDARTIMNAPSFKDCKLRLHDLCELSTQKRDWKAVRVDLIVVPASQFAYALVGWTGNKHFNRSLRHYTKKELNARLTSHGLWDSVKKTSIPALTEKQVFSNLKLDYLEPHERNT